MELQKKTTGTEELPALPASSCQPTHHIYFLRTHKTGSSTVGTIFLSYGVNRNRKIVLDPDLADMHWKCIPMSTINTFLKSPDALQEIHKRLNKTRYPERCFHFANSNLYDLRLEQENIQNMKLVKSYIDKIGKRVWLGDDNRVLWWIADKKKRLLLFWEFEDIVYFKLRSRKKNITFEKEVENNILTWNRADAILFDHFNKTFWKKVREAGSTFAEELETFRKINKEYQGSCESRSTEDQMCKLSQMNPCDILGELWQKRGHKYTPKVCGPWAGLIAEWRRRLNSTSQWNLAKLSSSTHRNHKEGNGKNYRRRLQESTFQCVVFSVFRFFLFSSGKTWLQWMEAPLSV